MYGTISDEKTVDVPATEAWKLYSTLQLAKVVEEALPGLISRIDVVQGDGGAGTILELVFPPGMEGGLKSYKEKFTVVDHEKRVKETEVVEGGYLDLGFTMYRVRFEVIEVEGNEKQCITRSTIEYELKEEAAANVALVSIQPLTAIMQLSAQYLLRNNTNNGN
ncbi:norbelladine synthase-like [Salvia splendens]|uniref:norbelladine synthase-like n=1 Tax=Salvia splendens TaxID=180675 RepID=UPI001C25DDF5|nr:norbelladine synthase-like [Salvia splendens]